MNREQYIHSILQGDEVSLYNYAYKKFISENTLNIKIPQVQFQMYFETWMSSIGTNIFIIFDNLFKVNKIYSKEGKLISLF